MGNKNIRILVLLCRKVQNNIEKRILNRINHLLCHVILSANQFNAMCNNAYEFLYVNKATLFYALEKTSDLLK